MGSDLKNEKELSGVFDEKEPHDEYRMMSDVKIGREHRARKPLTGGGKKERERGLVLSNFMGSGKSEKKKRRKRRRTFFCLKGL